MKNHTGLSLIYLATNSKLNLRIIQWAMKMFVLMKIYELKDRMSHNMLGGSNEKKIYFKLLLEVVHWHLSFMPISIKGVILL